MAFDRANDRLYVCVAGDVKLNDASMIYVFDHVSTARTGTPHEAADRRELCRIRDRYAAGLPHITGTFTGVLVYAGINGMPNEGSTQPALSALSTVRASRSTARATACTSPTACTASTFQLGQPKPDDVTFGPADRPDAKSRRRGLGQRPTYVGVFGAACVFDDVSAATNGTAPAAAGGNVVSQGSLFGEFAFP